MASTTRAAMNGRKTNVVLRGDMYYFRGRVNGKERWVSTGFRPVNRAAFDMAVRRAREIEVELRADVHGYRKRKAPTFGAWVDQFLTVHYPDKITEAVVIKRARARWEDLSINLITPLDVETYFRDRKAAGAKGGTLERERVLLARCFRSATDNDVIVRSPMRDMRAFKTHARTRTMSRDEEARLRAVLSPTWQRFLTVAVMTGLRRKELLGVRPCDLSESDGVTWITVRADCNKTRTTRKVPLRPEALQALKDEREAGGQTLDTVPFFPYSLAAPKQALFRACQKLDIRPLIGCHDLRRTFGTRCAEGGMRLPELAKIMGHTNPKITMAYYIHLEERSLAEAIARVSW